MGIDINPASTVIARARLVPASGKDQLVSLAQQIVSKSRSLNPAILPRGVLDSWVSRATADEVRALLLAIHQVLNESGLPSIQEGHLDIDRLSHLACFFYTACFAMARGLFARYGTTNPMWIKRPTSPRRRIRPSRGSVQETFIEQVAYLSDRLSLEDAHLRLGPSDFETRTATDTGFSENSFDAVITSPPYATRVDYIRGSVPELAVLGLCEAQVELLRSACTGGPKVKGIRSSAIDLKSARARNLLAAIEQHSSKGSKSYYLPWMANYLISLQSGLQEICRVVRRDGTICIVVQDSYYKELHVDMQAIVSEMLSELHRPIIGRYDYAAPNPRRQTSPEANGGLAKHENIESLLVFGN